MYVPPDMDCLAIGVEVVGEGSTETRLVSTSEIRKTVMQGRVTIARKWSRKKASNV